MRLLWIIALAALVTALVSCERKPEYQAAPSSGDAIRLPAGTLEEGRPAFHSFEYQGRRIDYFVVKVSDRVEAYFDACAKCYPQKKGYRVEGGELVCLACGQSFPMSELEGFGSCHPIPIGGSLEGDEYVIQKAELTKGAKYF